MIALRELLLSLFNALAIGDGERAEAISHDIELQYQIGRDAAWAHGYRQGLQAVVDGIKKGTP